MDHEVKPGGDADARPSASTNADCAAPSIAPTRRPPLALSRRGIGAGQVFALSLCDQRLDAEDFAHTRRTVAGAPDVAPAPRPLALRFEVDVLGDVDRAALRQCIRIEAG